MAQSTQDPRMAFRCEQYDAYSHTQRELILTYFYENSSMQVVEAKSGKVCLRRSPTTVPRSGFYVGAVLNAFGRPLKLTAYADAVTKQLCEPDNEKTAIVITESAFPSLGRCLAVLTEECGFTVVNVQLTWLGADAVAKHNLSSAALDECAGTRIVVIECARANAVEKGQEYAKRVPDTIAACSSEQASLWASVIATAAPACLRDEPNSTVVVLKPEVVQTHRAGTVLQQLIDLGLEPTALAQKSMDSAEAAAFLAPYRGILNDIEGTVSSFVGNVWVLQLISLDDTVDVVSVVRDTCGPFDPIIGKKLFPRTIRARFGRDSANNAVHCCDLPGEGPIYTNFFF